jgi:hypothetical protein
MNPFHPGEMLPEDFLRPEKITQAAFARKIGWTKARLRNLSAERRPRRLAAIVRPSVFLISREYLATTQVIGRIGWFPDIDKSKEQRFHPDFDVRLRASADHHGYALTDFDLLRDEWRNRDGLSNDQAQHDRPCSHASRISFRCRARPSLFFKNFSRSPDGLSSHFQVSELHIGR